MSDITVEVVASPSIEVTVTQAGAPGMSAYQHAVGNGFEGTVEEWLESLHGADAEVDPAILEAAIVEYLTENPPGGAVDSVAGKTGVVELEPADVGLGNVDNTADADKPVSTDTATALAGKSDTGHSHAQSDVTGLTAALAAKADASAVATALAGKSDTGHTHTASAISDFNTAADARVVAGITGKLDTSAAPEIIRDTIGTALVAGANVTLTVSDAGDTITIDATGGGGSASDVNSDTGSTYSYIGSAPSGTADGSSGWAITRITHNVSPVVVKHASGTWTGRAGLTYS